LTRRSEFKTLVSYRTYRLVNTSQLSGIAVSGQINSQLKRLRHYVDYKFSGNPAIQVLDFLKSFKEAADMNEVSEAAAAVLLPYFLDGRAKSGVVSRLKHIPASMPRYPAAVQWLLQSFATETVISNSYHKVFTARQTVDEDEQQFADRLDRYAAEAGSVFSEDALISAYVDGLLPYARNTVRGQMLPTMTFAEVQVLAEQAGHAGRALNSPAKASPRTGSPGFQALRSRPVVAATAGSFHRDAEMYADRGSPIAYPEELVAATDYPRDAEGMSDHSEGRSMSSIPSTVSAPSRDWVSASASPHSVLAPKESANAVEYRSRGCHLCFNPLHFLMDCPLLPPESRHLAQQQRDQKARDSPVRRDFPTYSRTSPRPPIPSRAVEPRRPVVAVNSVIEEAPQVGGGPVQPELPSEN
jgi:hypothetical protein